MKILIDIGHPAHVHYFRNFYREMISKGHDILITARKKDVSHDLLKAYGIPFRDRGKGSKSLLGKLLYMPVGNYVLYKEAKKFKPDLFLSFSSPYAAQVSSMMRKPHIAFDDTEHALLGRLMYRPFTNVVLSPSSYKGTRSKKQFFFNGYLELCYLHPNWFTPDKTVFESIGIDENTPFVLLRFVSWQATHDTGLSGISIENKRWAVNEFSKYTRVFISSEEELPDDLKPYQVNIPPQLMHSLLHYAVLFYGESATMASEAAILGTPAIYLDNVGRGYTDELEQKYGLVFNYSESPEDQKLSIEKGIELLKMESRKDLFLKKKDQILEEKIDVTQYLVDFIEGYLRT